MTQRQVQLKGETYDLYDVRTLVNVSKDLACHMPAADMESWFIVSNLESNGDKIGLQVHALIQHSVVSFNISVVNETKGLYKSFEYVYNVKDIGVSTDKFEIKARDFYFSGNTDQVIAKIKFPGVAIDIQTQKVSEPLLFSCTGALDWMGNMQYDYAFPRMATSGTVSMEDKAYAVRGITWLDRQWGDMKALPENATRNEGNKAPNPYAALQWVWINPQLSNGVDISFGEIVIMDKKIATAVVTILYPDGANTYATTEFLERSDYWESKATGNKYPTNFVLKIPHCHAVLEIKVSYKEQEILSKVGGVTKFEGMAHIKGTFEGSDVTGQCYVEMVGNWK